MNTQGNLTPGPDVLRLSPTLDRRGFMLGSATAAGLLMIGGRATAAPGSRARELNAWVTVGPGDKVTLAVAHAEMGQGITTTLPAVLAEELGADWSTVAFETADFNPAYRHPVYQWMFTGNSESIATYYDIVRTMGASARELLIAAAAPRLGVSPSELDTESSRVVHSASGRSLAFGEVAEAAAELSPSKKPVLRAASRHPLTGRALARLDIPSKVDGSAIFGIDVKVPGMMLAAVRTAPTLDGALGTVDETALLSSPGVVKVVRLPNAVAVVGKTWWQARRALDAASIQWTEGPMARLDTAAALAPYRAALAAPPAETVKREGHASDLSQARGVIEALYESPFQAHATMEPMNCTAHVTADRCEIWAPTQGTEMAHLVATQVLSLPDSAVRIHRTLIGGGFGRRLLGDFVKQCLLIAKECDFPVKVIWTREEDVHRDAYRPAQLHRIRATLGPDGAPTAMAHKVISPSMMLYVWPRTSFPDLKDATQPVPPPAQFDQMPNEGVMEPLYAIPNYWVERTLLKTDMAVSVWRTTGHGPNAFALESFIDELAHAAGRDPVGYRRALLVNNPRALKLFDALIAADRLDRPPPAGRHRGVAISGAFGGLIAQAVTIRVTDKSVKVERVCSIVDCGRVLDPEIGVRNIEGGVVWGLSALRTEITFKDGRSEQTNFDAFDPLHLWETPAFETHFLDSGEKLGGLGEIGPVPTLPAVCNAIFAATGDRIRTLPLKTSGYSLV